MKKLLFVVFFAITISLTIPAVSYAKSYNGDECLRDGECESGECKHFQCTIRIKPKGDIGDRCVFDGDCKTDECENLRCVYNENKTGYESNKQRSN